MHKNMTIGHFLAYPSGSLRTFARSDHAAWNPILSALHLALISVFYDLYLSNSLWLLSISTTLFTSLIA